MENYVGKRLDGRYEIMEVIGVGGMAVVYKAFDNIDHRIVAVKILKNEYLANADFKRRFRNESKAIAVLSHPNIVKVYDVSFGDAIQYIVMEYVEGITLKEYINQQGAVDPREAIYFITQLLRAMKHAHDKGIVHRDIKPQNILLISDGTIKVTDFGIARISENATRTMTDGAIGSVHYISPEQAKGSITDSRTDLYSAGVILYEMLTGKLPFQSDNAVSVALMQLQNNPIRPREINPAIPVGLEEIIIKAMQKNQFDRYQSAAEMLTDIAAYKNNPSVIFGYDYSHEFGAEDDSTMIVSGRLPKITDEKVHVEPQAIDVVDDNDYDEFDFDDKNKTKTIAVLSSVLAALIVFAIALVVLFAPSSNKLDVPNLIGLDFYNQVMNSADYADYSFNPIIDEDSDEPAGTIVKQEPHSGKISKNSAITVYISGSVSKTEVPDVYGYESSSAIKILRSKGFTVTVVKEFSDKELGTVIRTSPGKNEKVESGALITVYVATNEEVEPVDVPNLVGLTIAQAKEKLQEAGLVLDTAGTEYRPSAEPAGRIIGHQHIGEQVRPGTSIAVFVSTGKLPEETTEEESTEETTEETTEKTTKPKETTTKRPTTEPTTTEPSTTAPTEAPSTEPSTTAPTEVPSIEDPTEDVGSSDEYDDPEFEEYAEY